MNCALIGDNFVVIPNIYIKYSRHTKIRFTHTQTHFHSQIIKQKWYSRRLSRPTPSYHSFNIRQHTTIYTNIPFFQAITIYSIHYIHTSRRELVLFDLYTSVVWSKFTVNTAARRCCWSLAEWSIDHKQHNATKALHFCSFLILNTYTHAHSHMRCWSSSSCVVCRSLAITGLNGNNNKCDARDRSRAVFYSLYICDRTRKNSAVNAGLCFDLEETSLLQVGCTSISYDLLFYVIYLSRKDMMPDSLWFYLLEFLNTLRQGSIRKLFI